MATSHQALLFEGFKQPLTALVPFETGGVKGFVVESPAKDGYEQDRLIHDATLAHLHISPMKDLTLALINEHARRVQRIGMRRTQALGLGCEMGLHFCKCPAGLAFRAALPFLKD